jgi:hypothetical protein
LPPIDVDAVIPPPRGRDRRGAGAFAAGAVAQDGRTVARAESIAFLRAVAAKAGALRVYDPGRLRYALGESPAITCVSRREVPLAAFLGAPTSICTGLANGGGGRRRDLFGAMAQGVPVVCPRASIFAEYLDHGVDALLHDSDDEALEFVAALRSDPGAPGPSAAGRATAQRLFDRRLAASYRRVVAGVVAVA